MLICKNCGRQNTDPGGDLSKYRCGHCQGGPLVRPNQPPASAETVVASGVCAAIGAGVGGPLGAVVGALIGYAIGDSSNKRGPK